MYRLIIFVFALWSLVLSSCASIIEGPEQEIILHCQPDQGLRLLVNGHEIQFDDGSVALDKKRDTHFITLERQGYRSSTISFNREINPWWPVADIIWGPLYPVAVFYDWYTGSLYTVDPRDIHVVLRKLEVDR